MDRRGWLDLLFLVISAEMVFLMAVSVAFMARYARRKWWVWPEGRLLMYLAANKFVVVALLLGRRLIPEDYDLWWASSAIGVVAFGLLAASVVWMHTLLPLTPRYARLLHRTPPRSRKADRRD